MKIFALLRHCLFWVLLCCGPASLAQGILVSDDRNPASVLLDDTGQLGFEAMRARFERGEGQPHRSAQTLPIGGVKTAWFRIQLQPTERDLAQVIAVPHPGMDRVNLYHPGGAGGWIAQQSGDLLPVAQWPIRYLYPALAFTQLPDAPPVLYLEVRHSHPISVRWSIAQRPAFDESSKLWHLILGSYSGFIALVLVLSVYNGFSWRDPLHFFYAGHVLVLALTQMALTGLGGEYLWPDSVWWNNQASVVVPVAGGIATSVLLFVLMRDHRNPFWPCAWLLLIALIYVLIALGYLFIGRNPFFLINNLVYPVAFAVDLAVLVWYARRQPTVGLWILAGFTCLIAGACLSILRNFGLLPISVFTQYGLQIGSTLEIPLMLIGLYARSRERRDNQLRLSSMTRVDPLTGVSSQRVLMERLEALVVRQRRNAARGAVMRVRVCNLVEIREQHGLEAAQSALVHAAACITQSIAEGDGVGRHSDGDFVVLLEGRASRPHTLACARQLIDQGQAPTRLLPAGVVLNLHVVAALAPLPERNAQALLARMDATLDEMALRPDCVLRFLEDEPMSDLALV